jgi:hypothetical protein
MKIALCFSGQPRFLKDVSSYILKNICEGYDVDVFAHLWFDEDLQTIPYKYGGAGGWINQRISPSAIEDAKEIYNPQKIKVEKSKVFKDSTIVTDYCYYPETKNLISWTKHWKESEEPNYINRMVNNWLSSFYSLNQVNILKKEYEYENNFKYDFVVRCRTDSVVQTKIIFENYDPSFVHYTSILNQPDGMIADYLNFGGSKQMDCFMSTFNYIDRIFDICNQNLGGAWSNEMLHRLTLDLFKIPHQAHPIIVTLPRF